ncbi:rod-binding protein [Schnuerera ultunensis]|uniref:Flagellar protein FlgJ n=1 Tax=[Clostridium] ultunense Esp TaxID=1288971 RepID=A0A1M4PMD9_9FIRM|nr:rod-binding protein [Schnuerera ultunensis]SHD76617.1 Flagellar protein FlgJ [[Clostridium] ultunense Esp]
MNVDLNIDPTILHKQMESIDADKDDEALRQVCKEFESIFLSMMFKEMKKTIPEDGLIEKSTGREIFEDMHIDELSKEIANGDDGLGIAEMLYQQFKNGYISW